MLSIQERIVEVSHPLINRMLMKKEMGSKKFGEDVLIIETNFSDNEDGASFDIYLMDLLADLQDLKDKAEARVGKFDRIDICTV